MMLEILAIIPARGGSKGVPGKNIRQLAGKPLIAYSIEAARHSQYITRIIVSTDDPEIAEVAKEWGAGIPFMRPPELALDTTPGIAPVIHTVQWLETQENYRPDYIVLLQPTSPLRTAQDIDAAISQMLSHNADSAVSVCEIKHHPYWAMKIRSDGTLGNFLDRDLAELEKLYPRRQDLPPAYAENGAVYVTRRNILLNTKSLYGQTLHGYVMPPERSLDIDTLQDLRLAELCLGEKHT